MGTGMRIGLIGDLDLTFEPHLLTGSALQHAAGLLDWQVRAEWLATDREHDYSRFDGFVCAPGNAYRSMAGALRAIQWAREHDVPLLGTCDGFQRYVLGFADAEHAHSTIVAGQQLRVLLEKGSKAAQWYGALEAEERYYSNFGLNQDHERALMNAGLRISGRDEDGEARVIEVPGLRFFVGTLFLPQARSSEAIPHPLMTRLLQSAREGPKGLLFSAAERAGDYLRSLPERPVNVSAAAIDALQRLGGPVPERGKDAASVLQLLDDVGSPATMATAGPRYFGYVIGGALPPTVAATWLASAWDQNVGLFNASPVGAYLEQVVLEWLVDILELPRGCGGAFVTGAQMANFTALAAARHAVLRNAGWDVERDGLFEAPPISVVVNETSHVTVLKALAMLGLGRERVIRVPADDQGRMRAELLPELQGPAIVCAQVGNVNSGACDPIAEIRSRTEEYGAWLHVDGAFGLWARATPSKRHLAEGVERADSWAVDAHKWLNVPYDSAMAFVRRADDLQGAMRFSAEYLNLSGTREPAHNGPEFSRRARGVEIWTALRYLGRSGVAEMIDRTCRLAVRFADTLRAAGFEVLNDVVLNQVLVSFGSDEFTRQTIRHIQDDGTCWCGGTVWRGRAAMRISVSSWATTESDVDRSVEAMIRAASLVRAAAR